MPKINGKLAVNLDTWYKERYGRAHNYSPYMKQGQPCDAPLRSEYEPGDLVIINTDEYNKPVKRLGVVLGCIDTGFGGVFGDLRTDMCGMVGMDKIRHATTADTDYITPSMCIDNHILNKRYNIMYNVGRAKYVINMHNGLDKHKDGGDFFGIDLFSNKINFIKAINQLKREGYTEGR